MCTTPADAEGRPSGSSRFHQEGDLVAAADTITPALINFMTKHGRGLICLTLTGERCDEK